MPWGRRHWRALVVAGYAAILAAVALRHEPWFDEAQAWLLARDASPWELLAHRLHYEGSPGLWHLILMPFAKLGLPFRTVSIIAGLFSVAGVVAFVKRAPFPPLVVATVPFTYFVLFQYGVVARSYSLLLLLLSLLAIGWRERQLHPARHAVLLGLVSQVSVHGMIIALAAVAADLPHLRRTWQQMPPRLRRAHLVAGAGLALLLAATVLELWPTGDNSGGGSWHLSLSDIPTALRTFWASSPVPLLVVPALGVLLWWLRVRRALLFPALAAAGLVLLFVLRYASPWHGGAVFLLIVIALWISWPLPGEPVPSMRSPHWLRPATLASLLLVIGTQLVWTGTSISYDLTGSYSGTAAAARYLATNLAGKRIDAMGKWSAGILPYFTTDIFNNYAGGNGPSYWTWSYAHNPLPWGWRQVLADHPDAIVDALKSKSSVRLHCVPGYRRVAVFPGEVYFGVQPYESEIIVIYEPDGSKPPANATVTSGCGTA